jgi:hypothetical protein
MRVSSTYGPRRYVACDPEALAAALRTVETADAAAVPALSPAARHALARAAQDLTFRTARPQVGQGAAAVTQTFEIADDVPAEGPFAQVARELAAEIETARAYLAPCPCPAVTFNDRVVQRYPPSAVGISPHRDRSCYVTLVANLVITGHGRFYICADRSFDRAREIPAGPGDAILMRAPGYGGRQARPFHAIGAVNAERLVLGLRHDRRG